MNIEGSIVFFAEYFPYLVALGFIHFAFRSRSAFYERFLLFVEGAGAALIARGIVEIIRIFIHRPRPFVADSSIVALISETSYSFPSGHAAFFFALSTTVFLYNKRWGVWFFIASIIIGISRIAAGVHYPTDIFGGALLGMVVGLAIHYFTSRRFAPTTSF